MACFLPEAHTYEQEYIFWPWGALIRHAEELICAQAKIGAHVLDYMCGTGHLLGAVRRRRQDLQLEGCDSHAAYIGYARAHHPNIVLHFADCRYFEPETAPDVICCTAGLHHLPFVDQVSFIKKISKNADKDTLFIIGEEFLPEYSDSTTRRLAAVHLNVDLIEYAIAKQGPNEVVEAAIDVLRNDVLQLEEFKRSKSDWRNVLLEELVVVEEIITWTGPSGGGDVLFICQKRSADG